MQNSALEARATPLNISVKTFRLLGRLLIDQAADHESAEILTCTDHRSRRP